AIGCDIEKIAGIAEIMAQIDQQLTQTCPGLGCLPVRPQQRAKLIATHRLAVGQGKTGQQSNTLARADRNRFARRSLENRRAEKSKPVSRHEIRSDVGAPDPLAGRIDFTIAKLTPY